MKGFFRTLKYLILILIIYVIIAFGIHIYNVGFASAFTGGGCSDVLLLKPGNYILNKTIGIC